MVLALGLLSGCGEPESPAVPAVSEDQTPQTAPFQFTQNDALLNFSYSFPAKAAVIGPLNQMLREDQQDRLETLYGQALEEQRVAEGADFNFNPHSFTRSWLVRADAPQLLTLSAESEIYTGGAHGNTQFEALLWDKDAAEPVPVTRLFANWSAAQEEMRRPFCTALNAERERRRGDAPNPESDDPFDQCPPFDEVVIVPSAGDNNEGAITRLDVLIEPYVAGSYAEGSYSISVPVTAAILELVAEPYRPSFDVGEGR